MKATRSYTLSKSNGQIFVISYLYFSQVTEWKNLSKHINKNEPKFIMSCDLTSIKLKIRKVTRIQIRTRNKPNANIFYLKKYAITRILFISTKKVNKTRKWLIFVN